jgi:hypothetical protein
MAVTPSNRSAKTPGRQSSQIRKRQVLAHRNGTTAKLGVSCAWRVCSLLFFDRGWSVKWMLKLVAAGDVMEISKPDGLGDIANLRLTLAEAKQLLAQVQREVSIAQATDHAVRRPVCPCHDGVCQVKDCHVRFQGFWAQGSARFFSFRLISLMQACAVEGGH